MKNLVFALFVAASVGAFADDPEPQPDKLPTPKELQERQKKTRPKMTPEQKKELLQKFLVVRGGNKIPMPDTMKGRITIVNAQTRAKAEWIDPLLKHIRTELYLDIAVTNGTLDAAAPKVVGDLTLYLADDAKLPRVLVAPEDRWAIVNVAPLASDSDKFFEMRVKKEIFRGFAMLCGGMGSQYPLAMTGGVSGNEDLDKFDKLELPIDLFMRMPDYLAKFGVVPATMKNYRQACQEGWAPQPKDDVEKTIWNEVHDIPDRPIKIKYKKDKNSEKDDAAK